MVVWYSHLFKNFPQFVVIYIVKDFDVVSKAGVEFFLELSCFFDDPKDVDNLISGSSAFCKSRIVCIVYLYGGGGGGGGVPKSCLTLAL